MNEEWRPVVGWEDFYEVSDQGNVRSRLRRAFTNLGERSYGGNPVKRIDRRYPVVNMTDGKRRQQQTVHLMVLTAFLGPCPDRMQGCHNNGNSRDPRLLNLRWDTPKGNHADKKLHGTSQVGERNGNSRLTDAQVAEIKSSKERTADLAAQFGVSTTAIRYHRNGKETGNEART